MTTYAEFRPTAYDQHIPLDDREDWIVVPVTHDRDSGPRAESNFASALDMLGGESDTVEVHRFGHWGPGWFEIILAHPSLSGKVEEIESALANYPILDEMDLSERESEAEREAWESWAACNVRRELGKVFDLREATLAWFDDKRLFELYQRYTSGTEHTDTEIIFPTSWIRGRGFSRDDLAAWIVARRRVERERAERE
ncbi:MAG: hypothetical protein QUS11_06675 [Candidatus Fermentibacter sp.]|nr:hypothetical protein [Candidatus Fermentibacter sp.]